jgi:hypothetical protein
MFTTLQLFLLSTLLVSCQAGLLDVLGFGSPAPTTSRRFSFGQIFVGQWTVTRRDESMKEGHRDNEEAVVSLATYNILSENYTSSLVGAYYDDAGEVGHLVRLEFDDDTLNSGKFFTAGPKEEEEDSVWLDEGDEDSFLFDFDFTDMEGEEAIVTGNGMVMSSGIWRSKTTKSGWYNFVFHGPNSFVLNVVPHDTESSAFIVRGSRVVTEVKRPEQPWYSRLMLPLSMFLLFRRFLAPAEPARAEPARAEPPSAK